MTKNKIAKFIGCGIVVSVLGNLTDKIAPRSDGENPTSLRILVVIAAVIAVNFGEAAVERSVNRKLPLN